MLCGIDTVPRSFCHSFISLRNADDTLFEVGPEIRCSGASGRYCSVCSFGNHTAGSKQIQKLFIAVNGELNKVYLCQK